MKSIDSFRHRHWQQQYHKLAQRLAIALQHGQLARWSERRIKQFWTKLQKLGDRLGLELKPALLAGFLSTGLIVKKEAIAATLPEENPFAPDAAFRKLPVVYQERAYLQYDLAKLDPTGNLDWQPFNEAIPAYQLNLALPLVRRESTVVRTVVDALQLPMRSIQMDQSSDFGANYGIYGGTPNYRLANPTDPNDPPAAPTQPDLVAESDTGIQGDNVTNNLLPTIKGQAPHHTTIILESSLDGVLATNVKVDDNGYWCVQLQEPLSEGAHQIIARATNEAGTSPNSAPLTLFAGAGDAQGNGTNNKVTKSDGSATINSVVGGGDYNEASADYATVGGGKFNMATYERATVGGGSSNQATDYASTVAGGSSNQATGNRATVGGGSLNKATGTLTTIPGGFFLKARSFGETVLGINNEDYTPSSTTAIAPTDRLLVVGNGTASSSSSGSSNALVMLKNGNTTLKGKLTLTDGTNPFTLPNADGTANQVLRTDGAGTVTWVDAMLGGAVFSTIGNVTSNSPGTLDTDDFVFGSDQLGDADDETKDTRFFFDKSKGAWRAGAVSGDQWNDLNVGIYSTVAGGFDNKADDNFSTVGGGKYNEATGDYSTVSGGERNEATFDYTTVGGGYKNKATDDYATVGGGYKNEATDFAATIAGGYNNKATDDYATIGGGYNNRATDNYATISGGYSNDANGLYSTVAGGEGNQATGISSIVGGGNKNKATGILSIVGGGYGNEATGIYAIVEGGLYNEARDTFTTVGGGRFNVADGKYAIVGGGNRNKATALYATVAGGSDNEARDSSTTVGGGSYNIADGNYATIGGGKDNKTTALYATLGGGLENEARDSFTTIAGGRLNIADGNYATVGGGQGNNATGRHSTIAGGLSNEARDTFTTVAGGRLNVADGNYASVGGGEYNQATANFATIAGGVDNRTTGNYTTVGGGNKNKATALYATVGGGSDNEARDSSAIVAGGSFNIADGNYATVGGGERNKVTGDYATIAGGQDNEATGNYATIGGGDENEATGDYATIGGGEQNQATGNYATVGGGEENQATGNYSTIGGGYYNEATANYATIPGGFDLRAKSFGETAIGVFNDTAGYTPKSTTAFDAADRLFVVGNGTEDGDRSNALVMLKNGNTTLKGQLTLTDGTNPFTLPNTDGIANQILQTDGNGTVTWANVAATGAFSTTSNVTSNSPGTLGSDDFVFGSSQLGDTGDATKDARFFFDKSKAAWRAGKVMSTQWDDSKIGSYSTVTGGLDNEATGKSATIGGGYYNKATAEETTIAGGRRNQASARYATVGGGAGNRASATETTIAGGKSNQASADYATIGGGSRNQASNKQTTIAGGLNNKASNEYATIGGGGYNNASGDFSTISGGHYNDATNFDATIGGGVSNKATARGATVGGGIANKADADFTTIPGGIDLKAKSFGETVIGTFNDTVSYTPKSTTTFDASDRLFIIGNGSSISTPSNALVMLKNGNTTLEGQLTLTNGTSSFQLPNTDGTASQVLQTDGAGKVTWQTLASGTDDQTAAEVPFTATGNTTATNLQTAIVELQTEIDGNTAKVSADGSITTHSDVTDAGSGKIITNAERTTLSTALQAETQNLSQVLGQGTDANASTITNLLALNSTNGAKLTASGLWLNASDRSLKTNIKALDYGLEEILQLRAVEYDYKADGSHSIGFIAQELEKILPELVQGEEGKKALAYDLLTSVLVKAMQEMQTENSVLKAANVTATTVNTEQEEEIATLQHMVQELQSENVRLQQVEKRMATLENLVSQFVNKQQPTIINTDKDK